MRLARQHPSRVFRLLGLVLAMLGSCLAMVITAAPVSALGSAVQISAGGLTTCAVMAGGSAYCWGNNDHGQIGDGTTNASASPVLVSGGYTWSTISTFQWGGGEHDTCGVTTAGVGYCWGSGFWGAVGDGTNTERHSPTAVLGGHTWASIMTGHAETCGVTTAGDGYCWGLGGDGNIGDGNNSNRDSPTLVAGGYTWASISVGRQMACGVTTAHVGYCWGKPDAIGSAIGVSQNSPYLVAGGHSWASISIGDNNACGVTTTGAGYCWGPNVHGEIGDGTNNSSTDPVAVSGGYTWSTITENEGTCGLTTAGVAYCWGQNPKGQTGDGSTIDKNVPTAVSGGLTFSYLTAGKSEIGGASTSCGIVTDGSAYCWGYNNSGQIGDNTTTDQYVPTLAILPITGSQVNSTTSATVDPSFLFTVAGRSSVCNGQSATNFQTGATATAVSLGHASAASVGGGAQDLTVSTNAANGFTVYMKTSGTTPNSLRDGAGHSIADVSGTNASPGAAPAAGTAGFGYTSSDASTPFTSDTWAKLTNSSDSVLIGTGGTSSKTACIGYEVAVAATTPAGSYSTVVVYTAIPAF